MFRLNAPLSVIRAKVKKVQTNVAFYSHALLKVGKLFSELKLITDNTLSLFMQQPTEKPLKILTTNLKTRDTKLFGDITQKSNVLNHTKKCSVT